MRNNRWLRLAIVWGGGVRSWFAFYGIPFPDISECGVGLTGLRHRSLLSFFRPGTLAWTLPFFFFRLSSLRDNYNIQSSHVRHYG